MTVFDELRRFSAKPRRLRHVAGAFGSRAQGNSFMPRGAAPPRSGAQEMAAMNVNGRFATPAVSIRVIPDIGWTGSMCLTR